MGAVIGAGGMNERCSVNEGPSNGGDDNVKDAISRLSNPYPSGTLVGTPDSKQTRSTIDILGGTETEDGLAPVSLPLLPRNS